jgi:hypothetical protein
MMLLMLGAAMLTLFFCWATWSVYAKAGRPGWASLVPIYNAIVLLQIGHKPWWWALLLFLPFVNVLVGIAMCLSLARAFGRGLGFGIGLVLLPFVFWPVLGFGSARYQRGPEDAPETSWPKAA